MFDDNRDGQNGVSVWGHVTDGLATGAAGGALFGGIGAIPGAIAGAGIGLVNGLMASHDESTARETFMASRHDNATVDAAAGIAENLQKQGMSQDEAIQSAANQVFLQRRDAQLDAQGTSWFDALF